MMPTRGLPVNREPVDVHVLGIPELHVLVRTGWRGSPPEDLSRLDFVVAPVAYQGEYRSLERPDHIVGP